MAVTPANRGSQVSSFYAWDAVNLTWYRCDGSLVSPERDQVSENIEEERETDRLVDALRNSQHIDSRIAIAKQERFNRFVDRVALGGFVAVAVGLIAFILRGVMR